MDGGEEEKLGPCASNSGIAFGILRKTVVLQDAVLGDDFACHIIFGASRHMINKVGSGELTSATCLLLQKMTQP